MVYPLAILDPDVVCYSATGSPIASAPLPVGTSFTPGDCRIIVVYCSGSTGSGATASAGWTKSFNAAVGVNQMMIFTQRLTGSSVDGLLTFSPQFMYGMWSVTVRNAFLGQTWSAAIVGPGTPASISTIPAPSTTVTANSILLNCVFIHLASGSADVVATTAPGMTLIDSANTSAASDYYEDIFGAANFVSAGSSGVKSYPVTPAGTYAYGAFSICLQQNPDITVSMTTSPNELDAGVVNTPSIPNTQTHFTMGIPNETDTAPQVFTPLTGFRISPPLALPQSPITNSAIHWDPSTPAVGSTVTVETSVDGGASYQLATNDAPVPRLLPGTSVWQTVQTRVTLNRLHVTDPTPRVSDLEVRVATNASNAELVSLGLFSINNTNITITGGTTGGSSGSGGGGNGVTGSGGGNTGGGLSIEISGVDLSRSVARNSWEDVYFVDSGTNYADAIHDIIEDRLPNTSYNFASTTHVTPKLIFGMSMDSDPWQDAQDLATAIGMELFFDALGVCTLRDVPDPGTGQSVWTFSDSANPTIASATRSLTDQTVFNYIVAYGESVDNAVPVSAVAFDDNPNSPTYYLGAYGKVPTSFTSPEITTVEQAQAAADALLNLSIGNAENVEISVVPNPAIEPGDVVTVTIGELKLTGTFMVNDMNTPLSAAEAQTFTVYRQSS
jgi:uncharacterized membrane protein YgcG